MRARMHRMVSDKQRARQTQSQSQVSGSISRDPASNHARKHSLHHDFNASSDIRECPVLPEHPVSITSSEPCGNRLVPSGRILLQCCGHPPNRIRIHRRAACFALVDHGTGVVLLSNAESIERGTDTLGTICVRNI